MTKRTSTITHHPCEASLMSCAAGSMPEAFAAVMASHLAVCPTCREHFDVLDAMGVALLETVAPAAVVGSAPVIAMRAQEADDELAIETRYPTGPMTSAGGVPGPLQPVIGNTLDDVAWQQVAPGQWQYPIRVGDPAPVALKLVRLAPGQTMPAPVHDAHGMMLVLGGSYATVATTYRTGDVALIEPGDVQPDAVADATEGCVYLLAIDERLTFVSSVVTLTRPYSGS